MRRSGWLAGVLLGVALAAGGCADPAAPLPELAGAKYRLPVFAPSVVRGSCAFSHGEPGSVDAMSGKMWEMTTDESFLAMILFYLDTLKMSAKEDFEDCVIFEFTPKGGLPGELVQITIQKYSEDGKRYFSITELTHAGSRAVEEQ